MQEACGIVQRAPYINQIDEIVAKIPVRWAGDVAASSLLADTPADTANTPSEASGEAQSGSVVRF